jgi:transcriptional regulator of acetoin/glycerol metabolism
VKAKNEMLAVKEEIWRNFVTQGVCETHTVSPNITDSWVRCSKIGVNANDGKAYNVLEEHDIKQMLEQKRDIIEVALPFMLNLYGLFQNSGFMIVLSDENGYVMESFGDTDCMSDARKIRFIKGASWQEIEVGTNAIALSLLSGKAVQMSGAEHYCKKHHCFTCSAAPIYGNSGQIIAVLDLSGPAQASYSHTLGMVAAAANAISMQIGIQQKNYELSLMNKRLNSIFSTMSDGIILFDKLGIVKEFNPVAKKILGKRGPIGIGTAVDTIFGCKNELIKNLLTGEETYSDVEVKIDNETGISRCVISGEAIIDKNGIASGGIIVLRPIEKVQNLVNQFSGHYTTFRFNDIIGNSQEISEAIRLAALAANNMSNVILQGESGTGKEMFAQSIHNKSSRRNGPFIALNCGAIPRELVGSELFGYEDGAFTGAKRGGRPGNFELASGGTLFLDEIGDMPLEQQVALLRVLQEKKIIRVGGNKVIPIDVRVICATNKDLYQQVEKGTFRQDLYYRLNVFNIAIPPLRERRADIDLLFKYFTEKIGIEQGNDFAVEQDVLDCIKRYDWPGNVRELHNVAERACNLAENHIISLSCLPPEFRCLQQKSPQVSLLVQAEQGADKRGNRKNLLAEQERQEILSLLEQEGGNISRVAVQLGIARTTLYRKMKQYIIGN